MGVFSRFTDIINANINSLLEKAEQPDKMIKLIIQEMEETTVELRSTTAQYIAEKKSLMRQIRQLDNEIEHWQQKAELALSKNREDLAKLAIQAKHKALKQLNELTEQQSSIEKHLDDLQRDNQSLQQKLSEAKNKQKAYIIRQQSAQTRLKMREKSEQYDVEAAIYKFECYQQKN
jgi:phage shock protein A